MDKAMTPDHRQHLDFLLLLGKLKAELESGDASFMLYQHREDPGVSDIVLKTYHVSSARLGGFFIQQREPRKRY